jgi:uncharacterized protein (TIGR00369 family)
MLTMDAAQLQQLAENTFWGLLGGQLIEWNEKQAVVSLDIKPHHLNLIGILHGGVHASLIDSAMGLMAMRAKPESNIVTSNLNLIYVAPIVEGRLVVTAEVLHSTGKTITTQAYAKTETGDLCAFGTGSFRVIDKRDAAQAPQ